MGRVVHALLLALAVVVVSAMPGADAGGRGAALASEATASDPSHQLTSSVPVARRDLARKAAVEIGARFDHVDANTQQSAATLVPAVEAASRSALFEQVDDVARVRILTIATRASGRGPPTVPSPTSI